MWTTTNNNKKNRNQLINSNTYNNWVKLTHCVCWMQLLGTANINVCNKFELFCAVICCGKKTLIFMVDLIPYIFNLCRFTCNYQCNWKFSAHRQFLYSISHFFKKFDSNKLWCINETTVYLNVRVNDFKRHSAINQVPFLFFYFYFFN